MIRLALRLDDPSATSNQAVEARILEALARHGLCATFAVIPHKQRESEILSLTRERAEPLRAALNTGLIDIALHGHLHQNARADGHPSEFVGVEKTRQRDMIADGKRLLESIFEVSIGGFVPPWNSYDQATLEVLEESGFDYLSSNVLNAPPRPTRLRLLPLTCHLDNLRMAVEEARRFARLAPLIVVVMHHYDFPGGDTPVFRDHAEFDALLAWVAAQKDVRVRTLSQLAAELSPAASQRVFQHNRLRERLPWRLRGWLPGHCAATRPLWWPWR